MSPTRPALRSSVLLAGLVTLFAACAGQGDVDRTQPDALEKKIFFNADGSPRKFYYRKTTVSVPPTSSYSFDGLMGDLYKVRFEIREKHLMGYRAFDYAPGSQNPTTAGENNNDTPFLIFAIDSHFDIKREYNPGTGEETNVIAENTTDRHWSERQYMRVDWSHNLADPPAQGMSTDPLYYFLPASQTVDTGYYVGEADKALFNPDRPTIRPDYIDFVTKEIRTPDYGACLRLFDTFDDGSPWGCGPAEISYRNSLLPVPDSEYEPLSYPDRQLLRGSDGKPLRVAYTDDPNPNNPAVVPCEPAALTAAGLNGDDCVDAAVDQFSKFGFFRTVRPGYDPRLGATDEARHYLINRWNIWQDSIDRDANENPILLANGEPKRKPYAQRQLRQITYYLNPEFPEDPGLRAEADNVIKGFNDALKETAAALILTEASPQAAQSIENIRARAAQLPDIMVMKPNGCSLGNVQAFVAANPDVRREVERRDVNDVLDFDNLAPGDLLKACTALSVVTENRRDGDENRPKFVWQRNGDLRYSFLHWVDRPQSLGPLGYGPSSADPETGEIISAAAYIYGAALNSFAQFATDSVRLANGQLDIDDILSGKTISDVLAETAQASAARREARVAEGAHELVQSRLRAAGPTRDKRLVKIGAGIDDQGLRKVRGSTVEKLLLNDDVMPAIVRGYRPGDIAPADAFDRAMTKPWISSQAAESRRQRFQTLAQHGCVYMADFADDAILGTALELGKKNLTPDAMFKELRALIFRGLADHEVGHTVGLRHNFSGSTDALNYHDKYWEVHETVDPALQEKDYKMSEYAYSSVMDYGSRFNSDVHGLGKYDKAALRFGYGQLIDLIGESQFSAWTGLNDILFLWDYTQIPYWVGGIDKISAAKTTVMSYKTLIDDWTRGPGTAFAERPYRFCGDEYEGNFDCKTWDRGANQREIVSNVIDQFRNYYVFNAYQRDRTTWQLDNYLIRLQERYFNRYSQAFQFFFFYGDIFYDPDHEIDFDDDLLLAAMHSLNALGEILQTPEPGYHCPTAWNPNLLVNVGPKDFESECLPNSQRAMLTVPTAKPFFIDFSDDYYYRITRTGSLYEKVEALFTLTSTESRFFRVDTFADANRYSINYYRIFRDEMIKLLSGVIRDDPSKYAATMVGPNNSYMPTPIVDPAIYGAPGAGTPAYAQPGVLRIATPVNKTVRYWALLLSLARLGSSWDSTLDFQNYLAVAVKGGDDDFTIDTSRVSVREFTHPETGVVYRAPAYPAGRPQNIGAELIEELGQIVGQPAVRGSLPAKFGAYDDGSPLPDWYTARADLDAARTGTSQMSLDRAQDLYEYVNYLLAFRIEIINDVRMFRKQLGLLNGIVL